MSNSINECEDEMRSEDQMDSAPIDEGSCGGGGIILKKGPWTSAEDAILVDYVKKHGEGNWNAVQKNSGLFRCGKSCRLRWANHLRPNLKKGAFTADEEQLIIELHAKMGNKWARMAAQLPGRTDNEIKNFWNTRIKRQQRAGLPLYPPDVCSQALNESRQTQNTNELNIGDTRHHDLLQANNYEIPDVIFEDFKACQGVLSYAPALPDISAGSVLTQGMGSSQNYSFMPPAMHRHKRLRESETLFPGFNGNVTCGLPSLNQFRIDSCEKLHQALGFSFLYDPDPNSKSPPIFGVMPGSHALSNGNISASKPIHGAAKLELPSLQYPETDLVSWGMSPPRLHLLQSVDAFIQSPPPTGQVHSVGLSPPNSGMLDILLHESQTLNSTENKSSEKGLDSSVVTHNDTVDGSNVNVRDTEWEACIDPISPLGYSAASIFNECTLISGSSLDAPPPAVALSGPNTEPELVELDLTPDALFDPSWFDESSECAKDQSVAMADVLATLFDDDDFCSSDFNHTATGASTSSEGWGIDSIPWNNLPAVCQMPDLP